MKKGKTPTRKKSEGSWKRRKKEVEREEEAATTLKVFQYRSFLTLGVGRELRNV